MEVARGERRRALIDELSALIRTPRSATAPSSSLTAAASAATARSSPNALINRHGDPAASSTTGTPSTRRAAQVPRIAA
jgi:hypothetical protein